METINVKIFNQPGYCSLEAHAGCITLFPFEYRSDENKWYFWHDAQNLPFHPVIFDGPDFPMEYFMHLCRAKYFTSTGTDTWVQDVKIIAGKKYLKVAPKWV